MSIMEHSLKEDIFYILRYYQQKFFIRDYRGIGITIAHNVFTYKSQVVFYERDIPENTVKLLDGLVRSFTARTATAESSTWHYYE